MRPPGDSFSIGSLSRRSDSPSGSGKSDQCLSHRVLMFKTADTMVYTHNTSLISLEILLPLLFQSILATRQCIRLYLRN